MKVPVKMIASKCFSDNVCNHLPISASVTFYFFLSFYFLVANHDKTLIPNPAPLTEPPVLKGYLNKYTNVAKGYNTRWFVLKGGVLSCTYKTTSRFYFWAKILVVDYRHQDDETVASRGSISMKMAVLRDTERTRFEIHSIPSRSHHQHAGSQKWFMKANHPVEARRWTQAIAKSIEWYKMRDGADSDTSSIFAGGSLKKIKSTRRKSAESDSSMMRTTPSMHSQSLSGFWKKNSSGNGSTMRDQDSDLDMTDASPDLSRGVGPSEQNIADKAYNEEEDEDDTSSAANSEHKSPPHPTIDLQANAAAAQLELTVQMVVNLSSSASTADAVPSHFCETLSALLDSLQTTQTLLSEYTSMGQSRDGWYARQLRKERARQDVWEESLRVVVKEGENLEQELRKRSRNRGSRVFAAGSPAGTIMGDGKKRRPSALGFITAPEIVAEESPSPISDGEPPASAITPTVSGSPPITPPSVPAVPRMPPSRRATADTFVGPIPAITIDGDYDDSFLAKAVTEGDYDHDTDEEDEFFDAIEANALPNMLVYEALTSPSAKSPTHDEASVSAGNISLAKQQQQEQQSLISMKAADQGFYAGYAHMRTSLNLSAERPNASLWSVLKHSIGKDLTKISFPVFFNEPTSMLQRMVRFFLFLLSCYSRLAF